MNTGRLATPGKTRTCPHCKATILDSATVCPGCQHHLRFDSTAQRAQPALTPLHVEGTLRHPANGGTWEYSVVLTIRDRRGQEIARQVIGVGALQPGDERAFTLAVEVFKPAEARESKSQAEAAAAPEARAPGRPPVPPPQVPVQPARAGASTLSGSSAAARPAVAPTGGSTRPTTSSWGLPPKPPLPSAPSRDGNRTPVSSSSDSKPQPKRP